MSALSRHDAINLRKGHRVSVPLYGFTGTIKEIVLTKSGRDVAIAVDGMPAGSELIWVNAREVELLGIVTLTPIQAGRAA